MSLRIIHFSDVYNAWPAPRGDNCGGGARFAALVNSYRKGGNRFNGSEPMVVFSGDVFNPSIASQVSLGRHMVPVLNACGLTTSCLGNHDLDAGLAVLEKHIAQCNFPWLCTNLRWKATGKAIVTSRESLVVDHGGIKVGLIGFVEPAWVETLTCVEAKDVECEDFVACAHRVAPQLRAQGADIVVALTHMRLPNDCRLAQEAGDVVDLVLGGHDHDFAVKAIAPHGVNVVKSGTDFCDLSLIDCIIASRHPCGQQPADGAAAAATATATTAAASTRPQFTFERVSIMRSMPEDETVAQSLVEYERAFAERVKKVIGYTAVDLDCRFNQIRTRETNTANFVADCVRWSVTPRPDLVLVNSGTLRADAIIPAGPFTIRDLMTMLPMIDPLVVVSISGADILLALENGVSQVPACEGRFPCVSGVRFAFDANKPPGKRVDAASVVINGEPIDLARMYTLATKEYMSKGKDGYTMLPACPVVIDSERLTSLCTAVQRFFLFQSTAERFMKLAGSPKTPSFALVKLAAAKWRSFKRTVAGSQTAGAEADDDLHEADAASVTTLVAKSFKMRPHVDGRVTRVDLAVSPRASESK